MLKVFGPMAFDFCSSSNDDNKYGFLRIHSRCLGNHVAYGTSIVADKMGFSVDLGPSNQISLL